MVVISPRVKTSLERLYTAVDAPKNKLLELEVKNMSRSDVEQEIFDLTNELSANIEEIKRRAFNDGVRAALQKNAIVAGTETSVSNVSQPAPQTNVIIEAPAAVQTKRVAAEPAIRASDEVAAKLALLNDKIDEVDSALASIHEMQLDLQKTQDEVKREFVAKLDAFAALNREASEYVDSVRAVAARMTEVSARLSDALEENARARGSGGTSLSLDSVDDKLAGIENKIDSLAEKTASRETQEDNSRLLSSQGLELGSIKNALKREMKSVRRATKRIARVSRELGDVESEVRKAGRKTTRSVRKAAAEIGAKAKARGKAVGIASAKKKAQVKKKKISRRLKKAGRAKKTKATATRVRKKAVVVKTRKGEKVNVTINAA